MKKNEITKAIEKAICTNHTAKMQGMASLSTSPCNPICEARAKDPNSICSKCFARAMANRFDNFNLKLEHNADLLSREVYSVEDMPLINYRFFRLEAFGDLTNTNQVKNYFNFVKANPYTDFALWTKNPHFIAETLADGYKKPNNLVIIYSSPFMNAKADFDSLKAKYPFINKVFTVYTNEDTATEHGAKINCGARSCLKCHRCYNKRTSSEINELLK